MYSLGHAVLNESLPPSSMWMNMGYWKDQLDDPRDFPKACKALLIHVLSTAFKSQSPGYERPERIRLLDIGFGCGDQTLVVLNSHEMQRANLPIVEKYVGITQAADQHTYACKRIPKPQQDSTDTTGVMLFCEDASDPNRWTAEVKDAAKSLCASESSDMSVDVWMLGLDSILHLRPSRLPLLQFACSELKASFLAYDLIHADSGSGFGLTQRLLLRLVCAVTSIPYTNIVPETQYRELLMAAGYASEDIEIRDVSKEVFHPLHEFMCRQENQLHDLGRGLGVLRIPKWIFGWFARSGIVRGCIVVARSHQITK